MEMKVEVKMGSGTTGADSMGISGMNETTSHSTSAQARGTAVLAKFFIASTRNKGIKSPLSHWERGRR
jgi:hypothetical protein